MHGGVEHGVGVGLAQPGVGLKGASVKLNATNLFNKDYLSTCDGNYCYFGDQRSVVASATYQW
jgi:outer membrane receptor for ferric coprogen and ferric-rhodotorulic acid